MLAYVSYGFGFHSPQIVNNPHSHESLSQDKKVTR